MARHACNTYVTRVCVCVCETKFQCCICTSVLATIPHQNRPRKLRTLLRHNDGEPKTPTPLHCEAFANQKGLEHRELPRITHYKTQKRDPHNKTWASKLRHRPTDRNGPALQHCPSRRLVRYVRACFGFVRIPIQFAPSRSWDPADRANQSSTAGELHHIAGAFGQHQL